MKKPNSRTAALAVRIAAIEKQSKDADQFPTVIWIVGVQRGPDGELVETSRSIHWRLSDERTGK